MKSATPLVSVVTATYNRSQVLRLAIASLRRQTVIDWEQIVVGDACTDDSAEVVAAFGDQRLRYINRGENCGEQSGPNNDGCNLARGRHIAFLNHDDFWLPDHLETLLETIEREQADLAYARGLSLLPNGSIRILGPAPFGHYEPVAEVHASLWLFRRDLLVEVGFWRHSRECWAIPSQDWLIRVWRKGKKMVPTNRVTVIAIHSAHVRDCYKQPRSPLHEEVFRRLTEEADFRESELSRALINASDREKALRVTPILANLARAVAYRILLAFRIPPIMVKYILRSWRRGGYIQRLQRFRGSPVPRRRK